MHVLNIDERWEICRECPIYNPSKMICNPRLWINPDNNDISTTAKAGYIKGCGCNLKIKIRNLKSHCIAGKW